MHFKIIRKPIRLSGCHLAIGTSVGLTIDDRQVNGVILAENRADMEAIINEIGEPINLEPALYYSVGYFNGHYKNLIHPDVEAIRQTLAYWWWNVGDLFSLNGLERSQDNDVGAFTPFDEEAENRRYRYRSWFPSLNGLGEMEPSPQPSPERERELED